MPFSQGVKAPVFDTGMRWCNSNKGSFGGRKMIEIIKPGTKEVMKCKSCGCEFSYESEDIQEVISTLNGARVFVKCPQCSKECILRATK